MRYKNTFLLRKSLTLIGFIIALSIVFTKTNTQQIIPLYPGKIPNSIPVKNEEHPDEHQFLLNVTQPTLSIYLPPAGTGIGTAVVVCPGGGYGASNIIGEGSAIAEKLNKLGIAAFVLKYRLPDDKSDQDKSIAPLQDAQQALITVRKHAKEWNVDPAKLGIMGFSAGGHLASTAGTHFSRSYISNPDSINVRPDFMILVYPVISFLDSIAHIGSRDNLIGKNPSTAQIVLYSNELQVTPKTPPTFLIHAGDDGLVSVKNSIVFYLALQKNKVPAGLHIFPAGQHGFFLEPAHANWFDYCVGWLKQNKWIN